MLVLRWDVEELVVFATAFNATGMSRLSSAGRTFEFGCWYHFGSLILIESGLCLFLSFILKW